MLLFYIYYVSKVPGWSWLSTSFCYYFCYLYASSFICGMPLKDLGDHGSLRLPVFVTRNNLTLSHPSLIIFCYVYAPYFIGSMPLKLGRKHGSPLRPVFFFISRNSIDTFPSLFILIQLSIYFCFYMRYVPYARGWSWLSRLPLYCCSK